MKPQQSIFFNEENSDFSIDYKPEISTLQAIHSESRSELLAWFTDHLAKHHVLHVSQQVS